jgi:hypothetical protein
MLLQQFEDFGSAFDVQHRVRCIVAEVTNESKRKTWLSRVIRG